MSKKLLLSVALTSALMSGHAFAHDSSFQNNSCDMELDGHIQYYQGDLTVQMDNGSVMTIDSHHNMTINGESVSLDSEQQRWVSEYYNNIDIAIPMTLNIASSRSSKRRSSSGSCSSTWFGLGVGVRGGH